ncbi:hypothetical protein KI614_06270 [Dechloromonas denitrificans]|uniref:hypothetical protein n=1 Tax=Dechloromonas denitrificans TaxID=281362 RepID=UPI001CF8A959|nr:hypothetical protein [Dechloromonas denitrificans]UCV12815.1 hypothetical protein KI614_06270 [Dechloromonas denitrificans]
MMVFNESWEVSAGGPFLAVMARWVVMVLAFCLIPDVFPAENEASQAPVVSRMATAQR